MSAAAAANAARMQMQKNLQVGKKGKKKAQGSERSLACRACASASERACRSKLLFGRRSSGGEGEEQCTWNSWGSRGMRGLEYLKLIEVERLTNSSKAELTEKLA